MKSLLCLLVLSAHVVVAYPAIEPDTVIIQIGKNEEIKIISNSENELQSLSKLDLNAIIQDIKQKAKSEDEQNIVIQIEDSTGQKYVLKSDTTSQDSLSLGEQLEILSKKMEVMGDSLEKIFNRRGEKQEEQVHFNKKRNYGTHRTLSLDFGLNNYLSDGKFPDETGALYAVNPFYSWYIAVGGVNKTHITGPLYLDWGANVSWYNFKFQNTRTRIEKGDAELTFFEDHAAIDPIKSKLVVPYLNVSFVPLLNFGNRRRNDFMDYDNNSGFRIGLGGYAGYRLGGKTKYVFKEDGDRERVKNRTNFYVNNWRYGVRLQMGIGGFDFFANYDLNDLFNEGKGPQLNAFSFGLIF